MKRYQEYVDTSLMMDMMDAGMLAQMTDCFITYGYAFDLLATLHIEVEVARGFHKANTPSWCFNLVVRDIENTGAPYIAFDFPTWTAAADEGISKAIRIYKKRMVEAKEKNNL